MDHTIDTLALYLLAKFEATIAVSPGSRILVGICGVPASGKTSLALSLVKRINALRSGLASPTIIAKTGHSESNTLLEPANDEDRRSDLAISVSQDGWHLPRSALDQFDDVKYAYDRRGAAFTFDGVAFSAFIQALRLPIPVSTARSTDHPLNPVGTNNLDSNIIHAPAFSHTLKDPTPDAILIHPFHRIIVIEGLYTFLSIEPWATAAHALDERLYVDVDAAEARERLVRRHVLTGVAKDQAEAEWRADTNDIPNGRFIQENMLEPTRVIRSVHDPVIVSHGRIE